MFEETEQGRVRDYLLPFIFATIILTPMEFNS
jgi:hypothetical protein